MPQQFLTHSDVIRKDRRDAEEREIKCSWVRRIVCVVVALPPIRLRMKREGASEETQAKGDGRAVASRSQTKNGCGAS
eukprot:7383166-Prymnesium_polylepis.2